MEAGSGADIVEGGTFASIGSFVDPGTDTWSATVNYGDGSGTQALALTPAKTFVLSHAYARKGTYQATVTVRDDSGATGTDTAQLNVANALPVVEAGAEGNIAEGQTFGGSGSFTDAGTGTWTATVDYGEGAGSLPLSGKTFSLSHQYRQEGIYTVIIAVKDNHDGTGVDTTTVDISNVAPTVLAGTSGRAAIGIPFVRASSFSDPGSGDSWRATVDYGDGEGPRPLAMTPSKTFSLSQAYAAPGDYTVTVVVSDDGAASGSASFDVTVAEPVVHIPLRGSDRYDTAIKISQSLYSGALPAGSGLVVAPGETFPEALCGSPLAASWGGPVLLTYRTALANNVKAELIRLAPTNVFCIGMSTTAVTQVTAALPGANVAAINGSGTSANIIYDMSRKVANALETKVGDMTGATAIITVGTNFPDAIGLGPLACANLWPIILTNSGGATMHASATATFADLGLVKAIKVGTYAVPPAGVAGLANLSGADGHATNRKVAQWAKDNAGLVFTHIGLATGDKFPDALASGPYLAKDHGILLLSRLNGPLPPVIGAIITANQTAVQKVTFIACVEPVIGQLKALLP